MAQINQLYLQRVMESFIKCVRWHGEEKEIDKKEKNRKKKKFAWSDPRSTENLTIFG